MKEKIEYVKYVYEFLLEKKDHRYIEVKEWIDSNLTNILEKDPNFNYLLYNLDRSLNRTYIVLSESYPDILNFKECVRNCKIDRLID